MEPIYDFSWMQQLMTGKVKEKFTFNDYRAVAIEIPSRPVQRSPYHYRILFFSGESQKPILSLNLESTILGSQCFTEHQGKDHLNLGHTDDDLSYDEFKKWAMERAKKELN